MSQPRKATETPNLVLARTVGGLSAGTRVEVVDQVEDVLVVRTVQKVKVREPNKPEREDHIVVQCGIKDLVVLRKRTRG